MRYAWIERISRRIIYKYYIRVIQSEKEKGKEIPWIK